MTPSPLPPKDETAPGVLLQEAGGLAPDFESDFEPATGWNRVPTKQKFWPNLISSGLSLPGGDTRGLTLVRNVNVTLLIMIGFAILLGIEAAIIGLPAVAVGASLVVVGAAFDMWALRRGGDVRTAGHLAVGLLYAAVLGMNITRGGFYDVSSGWFVLVSLLAGLLVSVRVAWGWTAVVCVTGAAMWALPELGIQLESQIPGRVYLFQALVNRMAVLLGVGLLLTLFLEGQRRSESEIRALAYSDPLTGLQNRKSFTGSFAQALEAADRDDKKLALLFVDLDRFKEYNDTLGHAAGDEILRGVAEVLEQQVRSSDLVTKPSVREMTVSRLGGDEFTVILGDIGSKQRAAQAAQRLLAALCKPVTINGLELFVSASIGVSVFPEDGHDADTLLRRADAGMYSAKQRGGNSFEFFAPWMNEASLRRIFVENRLRRATARKEISVVYQPLFDARSGRIVAAEVLARWNSPSMGDVSPGEFIPIAEDNAPLIIDIGDWVLQEALAQLGDWHREGLPEIRMSVNYAAAQLRQLGSVEKVCRFLEESGVDNSLLELEITERIVLSAEEPAMEGLQRLRRRGVGIALDDFGTGNASISYLRRLPLSRVKIDRSFVSAITSNPEEANLTSAIVAMAKSLNLDVTAEGIESNEQLDFLRTIGCDELQGFLLSRPVPASEFAELLRRDRERHEEPTLAASQI